jgi:hypothetical protein
MTSPTNPASQTHPLISLLQGLDDAPIALLGGKGANLARLARARAMWRRPQEACKHT